MHAGEYLKQLGAALDEYRFKDVRPLTDSIVPSEFRDDQAKKTLAMMRHKRLFADMEHAASLFILAGHRAPVIRRQWAQALLDQNRVAQALVGLQILLADVADDPCEGPEVVGLIGHAYKQLYVNEGGTEHLVRAIAEYLPNWKARRGDYRWHGINVVALLARAQRDGIDPWVQEDAAQIARAILDDIEEADGTGVWDYGTAMEASVALGDEAGALEWASKYVKHPDADAFEIASTLRQMKEVWKLEETDLGKKLLPVLEFAVLQLGLPHREGVRLRTTKWDRLARLVPTSPGLIDQSGFEAVFGNEAYIYNETTPQQAAGYLVASSE
jgi:hypothetical protein